MNLGNNRWNSKYICDKCGKRIYYEPQKGIPVIKYFKCDRPSNPIKKDFDLCKSCEIKFREWLNTKEIPTFQDIINSFPIYEEGKR